MSQNKYRDLRNALSQTMLGQPFDPDSTLPESIKISHLVTLARAYGSGEVPIETLVNAFRGTGFDIQLWVSEAYDND
jgi:hypothetical protein